MISWRGLRALPFDLFINMLNSLRMWDYSPKAAGAQGAADPIWKLERMINFGMEGEKFDRAELEMYLPKLNIPENTRAFLELILKTRY